MERKTNFHDTADVIVVGAGNAAMCAAIAAAEKGASVIVLEKSPQAVKGGNTTYTHGSFRFAYNGVEEIQQIIPELDAEELAMADFGTYPEVEFYDDLCRMTDYKTDPSSSININKSKL